MDDFELAQLREDISLFEGPTNPDGSPTWNLHDPLRNQYFRIGWQEFEFLSRWRSGSAAALVEQVNNESTLTVSLEQLQALQRFLTLNNIVILPNDTAAEILQQTTLAGRKKQWLKLLKSYLFFKIRLVHPDDFLKKTLHLVEPLLTKTFVYIILILTLVGLYLVGREWQGFTNTFMYFFNTRGFVYFTVTIFAVKVLHELGHAYMATYYNCRVASMGVIFLVFWPVFYTDTTDAWRLTSKYKRLNIAAAGIIVELVLAVFATFLWSFLDDGALKSAAFFVATVSWSFSLLLNANPLLKFDGYYLLSDWLDISNLQTQAFAVAKWQIRRWFFAWDDPLPYVFSQARHNILVFYSIATWIYRFFLMLGIALLVYFMFFKFLGLMLMLSAIILFIVAPVVKEFLVYWQRRDEVKWNKNTKILVSLLSAVLLIVVLPWKSSVTVPALLEYQQHSRMYVPESANFLNVNVQNEQKVATGQILFRMNSPELNYKIDQLAKDINIIQKRIRTELGATELFGIRQADDEDLAKKMSELKSLQDQKGELTITAPFSGQITGLSNEVKPGVWLKKATLICDIVNHDNNIITAYVDEDDMKLIRKEKLASFYPENYGASPVIKAAIKAIDPITTETLEKPYLASTYEGLIAVHEDTRKGLLLKDALYRVVLVPGKPVTGVNSITRGTVRLATEYHSLLAGALRSITSVFIRESGF